MESGEGNRDYVQNIVDWIAAAALEPHMADEPVVAERRGVEGGMVADIVRYRRCGSLL